MDELSTRRDARQAIGDALICQQCGGQWFILRAGMTSGQLAFAADGHVRAFFGHPHCADCNTAAAIPD